MASSSVWVSLADSAYEFNAAGILIAKLWKNGPSTALTAGTYDGYAASVFVSGQDVFVTGYERNAAGNSFAKLWVNGVGASLSNGLTIGTGNSVFVSGQDVYVAGVTDGVATIWKNGIATSLSSPGSGGGSIAKSIHVSGPDVYVCGSGFVGTTKLWKNNVVSNLTDGTTSAEGRSVFVK